jgi:hypothetical protein
MSKENLPVSVPTFSRSRPATDAGVPVMPDLMHSRFGFSHTIDSSLNTLSRAGVTSERITINKVGRGWSKRRLVSQQPAPGTKLTPDVLLELGVAGDGLFYYLPTGMREGTKEGEIGIQELVSVFDDGVEKAASYARQGGLYFDLRPENKLGCARWIKLFGFDPDDWPVESWYKLALFLPCLHRLAGRERGLRLALRILLDLEIDSINWYPRQTQLPATELSRFGETSSQLGIDLIVGDKLDDEPVMEIVLGPVWLSIYLDHQTEDSLRRINQVLLLALPYHTSYRVNWLVGDKTRPPSLGFEEQNSVLGINTHLGHELAQAGRS